MKEKGRNRDMKIGIANDHSAVDKKNEIVEYLESLGHEVVNYGTDSYESCNYPEFGEKIGNAVASGEVEQGIAILAVYGSLHTTARIPFTLFAASEIPAPVPQIAKCIVDEWLNAKFEGGRHATRVDMIMDVEKRNHNL